MFEVVHTYDWYDGPIQGIADYQGKPHLFHADSTDREETDANAYLLMPVDPDTFALVLEDWAIWRRWETAFHRGMATLETHPALPEDRGRHDELNRLLAGRLELDPIRAVRKSAEFRHRHDPDWSACGWAPLEVRWGDPASRR